MYTLWRVSARFSASVELSRGEPSGDCSSRSVVEMMKEINRGSTPRFVRSSRAVGGRSGEIVSLSVSYDCERRVLGLTPWDLDSSRHVDTQAVGRLVGARSRPPALKAVSLI